MQRIIIMNLTYFKKADNLSGTCSMQWAICAGRPELARYRASRHASGSSLYRDLCGYDDVVAVSKFEERP
jgi:hypothetical protein